VTWRKQRRLANAAEYLLLAHRELRRYPARFDVVAISAAPPSGADSIRIDWIKSAFTL
jgi:Holliday junction resolvase-like predicted endonuclease